MSSEAKFVGRVDQQPSQQTVNLILEPGPLGHEGTAVGNPSPHLPRSVIGLPNSGQIVTAQELRQDLRVDFIGLDLRLGDRLDLERIANDDLGYPRTNDLDHGPGVIAESLRPAAKGPTGRDWLLFRSGLLDQLSDGYERICRKLKGLRQNGPE